MNTSTKKSSFFLSSPQKAADFVKNGNVVAFPTETVYGLGASIDNEEAIEKIFILKGRPKEKNLTIHISSIELVECFADHIPKEFYLLAQKFWPGPLLVILNKKTYLSDLLCKDGTVGLRFPSDTLCQEFINFCGGAIAGTSANKSSQAPAVSSEEVQNMFSQEVLPILNGGAVRDKVASTIISLIETPKILRIGSISKEQIESVLRQSI